MSAAKIQFTFGTQGADDDEIGAVIVPVFQITAPEKKVAAAFSPRLDEFDQRLQGLLKTTCDEEKFDASPGKILVFRKTPGGNVQARRLILTGLGPAEKIRPEVIEKGILAAMEAAVLVRDLASAAIILPKEALERLSLFSVLQSAVDASVQATYRSRESKEAPPEMQRVTLILPDSDNTGAAASPAAQESLVRARVMAEGRVLVKDLVNMPSNIKRTETLAATAREIAGSGKAHVTLRIDGTEWIAQNMPSFHTVALGSVATDPPQFIRITYDPPGAKRRIAVVGKSVVFDTGGYQVKTENYMNTMKGDMTGGAVALAAVRAASELALPIAVHGYLAATPNMIDAHAMLPDSIIPSTCGKKIEIRHTDAEGRLTLIDAVAQAVNDKPDCIITIATLTGAASRAVGLSIALMANDMELRGQLASAAMTTGEPLQTLDIVDQDYDDIKSKLDGADLINTSQNKNRGAQSAAAFVMSGAAESMRMAHLDIAGADMTTDEKATGISLKTMVQFLWECV